MIPEQMHRSFEAIMARLKVLEDENTQIKAYLTRQNPAWNAKITTGASGSITVTPAEDHGHDHEIIGYVMPNTSYGSNIRREPKIGDNFIRKLQPGLTEAVIAQTLVVTSLEGGKNYLWHELEGGGFVREDVVTFSKEKPQTISPINAALWPAPVTNYTITNHHGEHDHPRGIDYAAPMGTPVLCGPNGGHVVRVFECVDCKPEGDGQASYNNPKYGMGYGRHVVIRYEYAHLPPAVKALIPKDAFLFCMYAHLSVISVRPSVMPLDLYQEIGKVGSTGNSSGPHLHFECCYSEYAGASWGAIIGNQINPNLLVKA